MILYGIPLITDPCALPSNAGLTYPHFDSCKQYWRCEGGVSQPKCCEGYKRYDPYSARCELYGKKCLPEDCHLSPGNITSRSCINPYDHSCLMLLSNECQMNDTPLNS